MRQNRRILYCSASRKERRMGIAFAILLGILLMWGSIDRAPTLVLGIVGGLVLCAVCYFLGHAAATKGVIILEDGLVIPTADKSLRPRTFIPMSDICEIRLNCGPRHFKDDVEVITVRGRALTFSKAWLKDWDQFCNMLAEVLKDKGVVVV